MTRINHPIHILLISLICLGLSCSKQLYKTQTKSANISLSNSYDSENSLLEGVIKPYRDSLDLSMNKVLNVSLTEMTTGIPEGNLGNFVADLVHEKGKELYSGEFDFVLLNNGGLRTSLPKGDITRNKIYELMPFENELVVVSISMDKVIELFDFVAKKSDTNLSVKKGVPLSNSVKLIIKDHKAKEVYVNKEKIQNRTYKILTSDYLSGGGDKMNFFLNPLKTEKIGIKLRDAIMEYVISEAKKGNKLISKKDKRIVYER